MFQLIFLHLLIWFFEFIKCLFKVEQYEGQTTQGPKNIITKLFGSSLFNSTNTNNLPEEHQYSNMHIIDSLSDSMLEENNV